MTRPQGPGSPPRFTSAPSSTLDTTGPRFATEGIDPADPFADWNRWLASNLLHERQTLIAAVGDALGEMAERVCDEQRAERARELGKLRATVARLEGQVETLTRALLGGDREAKTLSLPNWRRDRDAA